MKLNQLKPGADIIVQMVMGKTKIEFHLEVMAGDDDGIYTNPYFREGKPLELNINSNPNVVCNIFGEDTYVNKRVSWNNVKLETVHYDKRIMYKISTMLFNRDSHSGERRSHERMLDEILGTVVDLEGKDREVNIHDVSDNGIAFYADNSVSINHDRFVLNFSDVVKKDSFRFKLNCKIIRARKGDKNCFFGCEVIDPPHDYLLYTFVIKLKAHDEEVMAQKVGRRDPEETDAESPEEAPKEPLE